MDERGDLPYKAEYAKSGRAGCKRCKDTIAKDSLRLAIMVQNQHAGKKAPEWFHFHCFWFNTQYESVNVLDIKGFNALRWEDQQKIKDMITGGREALEKVEVKGNYKEYAVEYAKSSRSGCHGLCQKKSKDPRIPKGHLRISRLDYDSEGAYLYGPQKCWYCLDCFLEMRQKLGFFPGMDPKKIPGFGVLEKKDQAFIADSFQNGPVKRKAEDDPAEGTSGTKKSRNETDKEGKLREQNGFLWKMRDSLEKDVSVDMMKTLLQHNSQVVPQQKRNMLDLLSDCMTFGAFAPCEKCGERNFLFCEAESQYLCVGVGQDRKACDIKTSQPNREEFKIPEDCLEVDLLKNYKYVARERVYPETSVNLTPLTGLSFVVGNKTYASKEVIASQLESMGAKVFHKPQLGLSACISSKEEFKIKSSRLMRACRVMNIPIVSETFLQACKSGDASAVLKAYTFSTHK